MLRFLRRIRRSLIEEGHLRKYLVYAIGEILLVMIGILLALQVNNWNERSKERERQLEKVAVLRTEIQSMQDYLKSQISILEAAKTGSYPLLGLMSPDATVTISPDSINTLFRKAGNTDVLHAAKLAFETKLNFESDQEEQFGELLNKLLNWKHWAGRIVADSELLEANREEGLEKALINAGVPGYLVLYTNNEESKYPIDYQALIRSREVYAILFYRNFRIHMLSNDLNRGLRLLDEMLSEIDGG